MPALRNKQILLASRPVGEPSPANFKVAESELREPGEGVEKVQQAFLLASKPAS